MAVRRTLSHQPAAERPCPVLGMLQAAIEPDHVEWRCDQQKRRGDRETSHGKNIIADPVEPGQRVKTADDRPSRPQSGQFGQADVKRFGSRRQGAVPIDPRRGIAMDLVDNKRPQHHRQPARDDIGQRRIRARHAKAARDRKPRQQPGQPRQPDACADSGFGPHGVH